MLFLLAMTKDPFYATSYFVFNTNKNIVSLNKELWRVHIMQIFTAMSAFAAGASRLTAFNVSCQQQAMQIK